MDFEVCGVLTWRLGEISTDDGVDGDMGNVKPYNSTQEGLPVNILPRNYTVSTLAIRT